MSSTGTILLVEDSLDDIELALQAFRKSGMDQVVVVREDGDSALEYLFSEDHELPSVVFLDLHLPGLSGHQVLRAIRDNERTSLVRVVVLTTSREPKDIRESYEQGAASYIVKPVEFARFVETVRSIGNYWLETNLTP